MRFCDSSLRRIFYRSFVFSFNIRDTLQDVHNVFSSRAIKEKSAKGLSVIDFVELCILELKFKKITSGANSFQICTFSTLQSLLYSSECSIRLIMFVMCEI